MYCCELEGVKVKVFLFFGEGGVLCKLFKLLCNYFFFREVWYVVFCYNELSNRRNIYLVIYINCLIFF